MHMYPGKFDMDEEASAQTDALFYASQQRKLVSIQRQKESVEKQLLSRYKQLQQFHTQYAQHTREREQRILEKLNQRNRQLDDEAKQLYGENHQRQAVGLLARSPSKHVGQPGLLEEVLSHRTGKFTKAQQQKAQQLVYLTGERQRLEEARARLEAGRAQSDISPAFSIVSHMSEPEWLYRGERVHERPDSPASVHSVHAAESIIRDTERKLPEDIRKYWTLRASVEEEYARIYKPYTGELGPHTYQPWQAHHLQLVQGLVEEIIEEFLDKFFAPDYTGLEKEAALARILADEKEKERLLKATLEATAVQLIAEEVVLEVTGEMSGNAAHDIYHLCALVRNITDTAIITGAEHVCTGRRYGRSPDDSSYNLVTKVFRQTQTDRNQFKRGVWSHTQHLHLREGDSKEEQEGEDEDVHVIDYNQITPTDLTFPQLTPSGASREERLTRQHKEDYTSKELQYWQEMEPSVFSLALAKKCQGVRVVHASQDHRYLAVGTGHGDVIVYGMWTEPWLPVRLAVNNGKLDDAVTDIRWTLDSSQIVSLNSQGSVQLWSMAADGPPVDKSVVKALGVTVLEDKYLPHYLTLMLSLDPDLGDFKFTQGSLSERASIDNSRPTAVIYYPDITLLGLQHSVCICLDNGDVLKCDTEQCTPLLHTGLTDHSSTARFIHKPVEASQPSYMGQSVGVELLRRHKFPLLLIGFVDNCADMITVDQKGYINLWKYSRSELSGFDWFEPEQKYRLCLTKTMYSPAGTARPNVIFTDKTKAEKRGHVTRQDLARERKKVEDELVKLRLGQPWHVQHLKEQKIMTSIHAPEETVSPSGALFHIIVRHFPSYSLSTYFTQIYKPVKVKCTKILDCAQSPCGGQLIFLLLFPEYPPKDFHISIVVVDLHSMRVEKMRRDISITEEEYGEYLKKDIVSCEASRVHGALGSGYLFLSRNGQISAYSLLTGQLVLRLEDSKKTYTPFGGCGINSQVWKVPPETRLTVASCRGKMFVINFARKHNTMTVLEMTDANVDADRRSIVKAFKTWGKGLPGPEQRVNNHEFYIKETMHPVALAHSLTLSLVDRVLSLKKVNISETQKKRFAEETRVSNYVACQTLVIYGCDHFDYRNTYFDQDYRQTRYQRHR